MTQILSRVPAGSSVHVPLNNLSYIDHSCLELFEEFYELQNNQSMTEVQEQFVEELLRGMKE